ncbi:shikimate dehydrogenase [Flavobacteriaceae bacterium F08102]|nr:shikimate dehydrogenase [Flavobacteriaceae bacterium F08102]
MENKEKKVNKFGLLGKHIDYSFSRTYFKEKFQKLGLDNYSYENFDLEKIEDITKLNLRDLSGFNVTIPYKEAIIPYLFQIDKVAETIGAVNTVKIENGKMFGFNTDAYGFETSIQNYLQSHHKNALIFGTGGASKAIKYVLNQKGISFTVVSRSPSENQYGYDELTEDLIEANLLLINCTPVGTFPDIDKRPKLPYEAISSKHLLFDLIYNPSKTAFLKAGDLQGATTVNGLEMLQFQAEKAWEIWGDFKV